MKTYQLTEEEQQWVRKVRLVVTDSQAGDASEDAGPEPIDIGSYPGPGGEMAMPGMPAGAVAMGGMPKAAPGGLIQIGQFNIETRGAITNLVEQRLPFKYGFNEESSIPNAVVFKLVPAGEVPQEEAAPEEKAGPIYEPDQKDSQTFGCDAYDLIQG